MPHVGVTLKNSKKGVVVTNLFKCDLGIQYLRKGVVIESINGIPAVHHKTMIALIDACSMAKTPMHIKYSTAKTRISKYLRKLATEYHYSRATFHPEWTD